MFTTSLTAMAVASLLASNSVVGQPKWETDYAKAIRTCSEVHKPVAVFIAAGAQAKLVDGGFSPEVARLLREKFVALHVDTTTAQGKKLAESFALAQGLVISDQTGNLQALRHDGTVSADSLKTYLEKFSTETTVTTTINTSTAAPSLTQATAPVMTYSRCANGSCGQVQYVQQAGPVMNTLHNVGQTVGNTIHAVPQYIFGSTGGCANGNCGRR